MSLNKQSLLLLLLLRSRFARSTIREEKWGLLVVYTGKRPSIFHGLVHDKLTARQDR